jgi:hypothetical protein
MFSKAKWGSWTCSLRNIYGWMVFWLFCIPRTNQWYILLNHGKFSLLCIRQLGNFLYWYLCGFVKSKIGLNGLHLIYTINVFYVRFNLFQTCNSVWQGSPCMITWFLQHEKVQKSRYWINMLLMLSESLHKIVLLERHN